jgi:hypothetical protein
MTLIYVLALLKFVFPFVVQHSAYGLHRDEFLYLAEGRHLAWGYLELPPVLSLLSWVTDVMGGSLFWVKFWPALGGALTYVLVGRIILLIGGGRWALVIGFLPFVFGYFVHVHFILQPNFLEMFFCTLMMYGVIRYLRTKEDRGLYIMGIGFGLGMMSKYSVVFFMGAMLFGLLLTPERKIFRNKHFYYGMLVGLVLLLPNVIWQAVNGWPIVNHMKELQQQQLNQVSRLNFVLDQLSLNLPGLPMWIVGLVWVFAPGEGKTYRFAGWTVLAVLLFLTAARGKSYYAMEVYPVLFAFGAMVLERVTAARRGWRFGLVGFIILTGCFINMISLPMLPPQKLVDFYQQYPAFRRLGFLRWEDQQDHPLPQDFADMLGWEELAAKTAKVYHLQDSAGVNHTVLDGGNYGEAGALDYYAPSYGLPPSMGHGANYLLWTPKDFYTHDTYILTTDNRAEIHDDFMKKFASAVVADSITTPFAREYGSYIILMKGPNTGARRQWADYYDELRRESSIYGRAKDK